MSLLSKTKKGIFYTFCRSTVVSKERLVSHMIQVTFNSLFWHFLCNYTCFLNKKFRSLPYKKQKNIWLASLTLLKKFVCEMLLIHPPNSLSPFLSTFSISNHHCRCTWHVPCSFPLVPLFMHCQFMTLVVV